MALIQLPVDALLDVFCKAKHSLTADNGPTLRSEARSPFAVRCTGDLHLCSRGFPWRRRQLLPPEPAGAPRQSGGE
ncbi:hypothetical protein AK812_SmicGene43896, partial [Symbiodinium microadriaticum]